jgi:hypothetical protein
LQKIADLGAIIIHDLEKCRFNGPNKGGFTPPSYNGPPIPWP